ncbi:MAG: phosphoglycolate phosphatase [Limisphaerales bacterium]
MFFDLDGTLTDPKQGITKSIQHALTQLGRPVPSTDELRWCIGPPLHASFVSMVGVELADQGLALYRERFSEKGWRENMPYEGVENALSTVFESGAFLYVATSKPLVFAERILNHFELAHYFQRVFGPGLDDKLADKTTLLEFALSEVKLHSIAVMIGDRSHDVIGANNNGMQAIGVSYGYGSVDELNKAGAVRIAHSPDEVAHHTFDLLSDIPHN